MAHIQVSDDAAEVYGLLKALHVGGGKRKAIYAMAQEVGLLELVRLHVPSVMRERLPHNQLIARAFDGAGAVGGHAVAQGTTAKAGGDV